VVTLGTSLCGLAVAIRGRGGGIEQMWALRSDGAGYQRIAETLDSKSLPARKGSPRQAAFVRRTLLSGYATSYAFVLAAAVGRR